MLSIIHDNRKPVTRSYPIKPGAWRRRGDKDLALDWMTIIVLLVEDGFDAFAQIGRLTVRANGKGMARARTPTSSLPVAGGTAEKSWPSA